MEERKQVNTMLVQLFTNIMDWEERALITEEFQDITNNDMHIIDAIGIDQRKNMSAIAKKLHITVGTLTIAINNLLKKGYVERTRGQKDKRVVFISLSEKGKKAYRHHEKFHKDMVDSMLQCLNEEEMQAVIKGLGSLCQFMDQTISEAEQKQ
jgi:DNA-binding MarR family transcriptional regulator